MTMSPPMVGTPFFATLKGSVFSSRWVSEMWWRFMKLMKELPNQMEVTRAMMPAVMARKEI